jgi:hypothetical protein
MTRSKLSTILLLGWVTVTCVAGLCAGTARPVMAEDTEAVVTARRLFLRRGPGTEFPPYSTIGEGSTVRVQEFHGKWARVTTSSGQTGYVHGDFLRLLDKQPEAVALAPAQAAEDVPEDDAALSEALQRNKELEGQVQELRDRLAAVEAASADEAPAQAAEPEGTELARLAAAVASLEARFDQARPAGSVRVVHPNPMPEAETSLYGNAILFGILGLAVGWAAGSYVRRSERGRRSRIRL